MWLLSDRAVKVLMRRSMRDGEVTNYDMYGEFGCCLGTDPTIDDPEVNDLKVAILPLPGGEFYHFGTSHEIVSSMVDIQNIVNDQREIMHHSLKPHPSMFTQNSEVEIKITEHNQNLWIENSCVSALWTIAHENIITGVPRNQWKIELRPGQCVDIVPIGDESYAIRPYGFNDKFRGDITDGVTEYLGEPFTRWAEERGIDAAAIEGKDDLQSARIFPVVDNINDAGLVLRWMLNEPYQQGGRVVWNEAQRLSADEISAQANLRRLVEQRRENRAQNWSFLSHNYAHSVFYQVDLDDAAHEFAANHIAHTSACRRASAHPHPRCHVPLRVAAAQWQGRLRKRGPRLQSAARRPHPDRARREAASPSLGLLRPDSMGSQPCPHRHRRRLD